MANLMHLDFFWRYINMIKEQVLFCLENANADYT
jgi:hypothetical protein